MDVKEEPLVSVLISVYNEEKWIKKSLNSILNQTYKRLEIIIINDGSTDNTLNILKKIKKKDKRIKIFNQKNKGLTKSLNIGIKYCKGKYIARMDADEISFKNRIKKQVLFLEKNKDYALVGGWRIDINKNQKKKIKLPINDKEIKEWLIRACVISHGSVMIRSKKLKKYKYDENFRTSQDYDLWIRMAKKEKFYNLPEYLNKYYIRNNGITKSKKRIEGFKTKLRIHRKALKNIPHPFYRKIWIIKPFHELIR